MLQWLNKIKYWFYSKRNLIKQIDLIKLDYEAKIKIIKTELIDKVSHDRAKEIIGLKNVDLKEEMSGEIYRSYLEEAEKIYALRPWKNIISKFQLEQMQFIFRNMDVGEIGEKQMLVCRGGIIFSDYAQEQLNDLHLKYLEMISGSLPVSDEEKYKIFS